MWIGYNTNLGVKLYSFILAFLLILENILDLLSFLICQLFILLLLLAIAARLYAIDLGIYGYSQSPEKLTASIGIAYILLSLEMY